MSVLQQIYLLTETLSQLVTVSPSDEERDGCIERVEGLLEERRQLLNQLQPPFSAEEQQLGQKIVEMNRTIDFHLKKRKEEVAAGIRKLKQKKQQANQYANPYAAVSFDGTFYDTRK